MLVTTHAVQWEQSQVHNIDRDANIGCETTAGDL